MASVLSYTSRQTKTQLYICQNLKGLNKSRDAIQDLETRFRCLCATLILDLFATKRSRFSQRLDQRMQTCTCLAYLGDSGIETTIFDLFSSTTLPSLGRQRSAQMSRWDDYPWYSHWYTHASTRASFREYFQKPSSKVTKVCVVVPQKHWCNLIVILHPNERFPRHFVPAKLH